MSAWNFEHANTDSLFDAFRKAAAECENCLRANLPIPAYEQAIKASHTFNLLQARGVISVAERQAYIGRVRDLAKGACAAWMTRTGGCREEGRSQEWLTRRREGAKRRRPHTGA
jgi:glycyl-tRNA synthetase alpha chain